MRYNGREIVPVLSDEQKCRRYLAELGGKVSFHTDKDISEDDVDMSETLVGESVCDDWYIRDGQSSEGYIREVRLENDDIKVDVCLNRCGVCYDEFVTFSSWDMNESNGISVLEFLRAFGDRKTVKRLMQEIG